MDYKDYYRGAVTLADRILQGQYEPTETARENRRATVLERREKPKAIPRSPNSFDNVMLDRMMELRRQNEAMKKGRKLSFGDSVDNSKLDSGMGGDTPLSFGGGKDTMPDPRTPSGGRNTLMQLMDKHEGGGRYDTLFGHSQKDVFAGTDVTKMSLGEVLEFSKPSGRYAQWVNNKIGRVATPMGRYQYVGRTLRERVNKMGLDLSRPFDEETQDLIFEDHLKDLLSSRSSLPAKRSILRSTWEGFKHASDEELDQAIMEIV